MTGISTIENKISTIRKHLAVLERYLPYSPKELEENTDIRGAVERYLYIATQATIDLSEAIISHKSFRKPSTMNEAFYILNEEGLLPTELTEKLVRMTGFRNVLAHDYMDVDFEIVYRVLHKDLDDIRSFISLVQEKML